MKTANGVENSLAVTPSAHISWRTQERSMLDWKAYKKDNPNVDLGPYFNVSKSRVFRIKKIEE